jgi:hypothetical protein
MKLLTERFRRDPLPELSTDDLEQVYGGDRSFVPSRALDDERDALSDADAHGAESELSAGAPQLVHRGRDEPGA